MRTEIDSLGHETRDVSFARSLHIIVSRCQSLMNKHQHYMYDVHRVYESHYTVRDLVDGPVSVSLVTPSMVDFWIMIQTFKGRKVDLDSLFPCEYATNMKKVEDGKIVLTCSKYVCLTYPHTECVVLSGWSFDNPVADRWIVDFIWNVFFTRLKTPDEILDFVVSTEDGYLLTPEESRTLVKCGKHGKLGDLQKTTESLEDLLMTFQHMSSAQTVPPPVYPTVMPVPFCVPAGFASPPSPVPQMPTMDDEEFLYCDDEFLNELDLNGLI